MSQGNDDLDHPILNLTSQEKAAYSHLFNLADTDSLNVVTGERAVSFFEKTSVPAPVLGEIWQIADTENRGLLTRAGFCMVLRLIGWYQAGQQQPSTELAFKPAPLPKFDGITLPGSTSSPTVASFPQGALQPQLSGQSTGSGPIRVPPLDPAKVQQYSGLFARSGAQNGLLDGGTAKSIFERAGLPNEALGKIWMLSDREQKGALDETDFIVAMHLLTSMKTRAMTTLPSTLPPGLYEAAARRGQRPPSRQTSVAAAAPGVARQFTGGAASAVPRTQSPLARPPSSTYSAPIQSAQTTGAQWLVTPQEKAQYDQFFSRVDTAGRGVLSGEQAVQFFSDSRLPEDKLASIWDLADINSGGQLNRDEFAVAMYLIRQQRAPNPPPMPAFLPSALIPPSMRGPQSFQQPPASAQQPTPFDSTPTPSQPKSASDDLFGLDSSPTQTQPPQLQSTLQPQGTGASATRDPFAGSHQSSPSSPARFQPQQTAGGSFKQFIPTSAFGASLAAQHTGTSTTSSQGQQQTRGVPMPSTMDDLLGDNEANTDESRNITSDSTELANMSNQMGNLRNQMETTQGNKMATESDLKASNTQKTALEQRLQSFRSQYEAEVRTVKEMEQQLTASQESTKKLNQDLAMLEGTMHDLQTQHKTVSEQLRADQQENVTLKQKISDMNAEVTRLKPEIEKMKLDARQQKGLVSINKKQLATSESERDRALGEKADLEHDATAAEEQTRSLAASPEPAVTSPISNVASPAASTMSSTNPFFRTTSRDAPTSPPTTGPNPSAFDAIFGPAHAFAPTGQAGSRTGTPPATSFIGRSMPSAGTAAAVGGGALALGAAAVGGVAMADSMSSAGEHTPAATPPVSDPTGDSPLNSAEPPPPPESRQFTPTNLPIGGGVVGGDDNAQSDAASSMKVMPPASRAGGVETPRELPSSPPPVFGSASSMPGAFSSEESKPEEPEREIIPGAFPAEDRRPSIIAKELPHSDVPSSENLTPAPQPRAADDFDSAFAGFGDGEEPKEADTGSFDPSAPSSSQQPRAAESEFPPIQNLDQDNDESDSDDDADTGFDDDFTTASPPRNGVASGAVAAETATEATARDLPDIAKETSPPTYDQLPDIAQGGGSEYTNSSNFPPRFESLLPAREDPTSPPPPADDQIIAGPPDSSMPVPVPSASQPQPQTSDDSADNFVDASSRPLSSVPDFMDTSQTAAGPSASAPRNAFDEFDDFNDLSEAKEADKTGSDLDFAFGRQSHDEFNPAFDSPAASQTPTPLKSLPATQESNGFANFTPNESTSDTSPFGGGTGSVQRTPQDAQHDWDSIFSGLDNSKNVDTSFGDSDEIWQPPPGPPPGREPITTNGNSSSLASPTPTSATVAKAGLSPLGRAITPGTEHDDPILKRLTGMGYTRTDALNALEMYDYDINKAVDHLAGS